MKAVHDEVILKRREKIEEKKDYHDYLEELREDFSYVCGYCGKTENATRKGFEIDHLVPISHAPNRELDYQNLVYCCFTCNRKKSSKFPMAPRDELHDDEKGIIDPITLEYNENIGRDENGNIVGITKLGKYVCKEIFLFDIRPMSTIYKLSNLKKQYKELILYSESLSGDKLKEVKQMLNSIDELDKLIFQKKE